MPRLPCRTPAPRPLLTAAAALLVAAPLPAQEVLYFLTGPNAGSRFGRAMTATDDLDGDGVPEFLVGIPGALDFGRANRGAAFLYSGRSGTLVRTHFGGSFSGQGDAVADLGDVDGDGVGDYLVAAPFEFDAAGNAVGAVRGYSGRNGSLLGLVRGTQAYNPFGQALTAVGDLDGDRVNDFLVSEVPNVFACSGATFGLIQTLSGSAGEGFGQSLAPLPDLDGDGLAEFTVGRPGFGPNGEGRVDVYTPSTWTVIRSRLGVGPGVSGLGSDQAALADRNGDGVDDLAVTVYAAQQWAVMILSGADFSLLPSPGLTSAQDVADVGDANGDGMPELLCGAAGFPGRALLHSGSSQLDLYQAQGGSTFGVTVAGLGDLDGDGCNEFAVAEPSYDPGGGDLGAVTVYRGHPLFLSALPKAVSPNQVLSLTTREGASGQPTLTLAVRVNGVPGLWPVGGVGAFDASGTRVQAGPVPPSLSGLTVGFQAVSLTPGGAVVVSGVEVVIVR